MFEKIFYSPLCTFTVVWLLTILTYTQIEHAKKSTCLFNTGFCQPMSTRIKEHLETDKKSHVYKHLNESQGCKALSNNDCFSILDYATTQYSLSIKEGMHIGWQKPVLNKHVDFLACSICV